MNEFMSAIVGGLIGAIAGSMITAQYAFHANRLDALHVSLSKVMHAALKAGRLGKRLRIKSDDPDEPRYNTQIMFELDEQLVKITNLYFTVGMLHQSTPTRLRDACAALGNYFREKEPNPDLLNDHVDTVLSECINLYRHTRKSGPFMMDD